MTRRTLMAIGGLCALVVAAMIAIALWHSTSSEPSAGLGSDADHVHTEPVDDMEPGTVTTRAFDTMFSWQPATEPDSSTAFTRAGQWFGGAMAAAARNTGTTQGAPRADPRWALWAASNDIVAATTTVEGMGVSGTEATVLASVRQTVHHLDGSTTPLAPTKIQATLSKDTGRWLVTEFSVIG